MAYATTTQVINAVQKMKEYHDTHSSKETYEEEITTPSDTWTIQHNLKSTNAQIIVYDADGNEVVLPEITYNTENLLTITFDVEIAGKVIVIK